VFVAVTSLLLAARVGHQAWVSEDAFITFRYVANLLDGHGAVFNVGEHVQGYTHPLWLAALAAACLAYRDPVVVSTALSLLCTVALVVVVGRALLLRAQDDAWRAAGLLTLVCSLWATSRAWVSFQTSGLESSLSGLLLAALAVQLWPARPVKPVGLGLTFAALVLTRPDFLLIVAPIAVVWIVRQRGIGPLSALAAGLSPALAWAVFAWLYYGTIVANTAHAKLGLWSSWRDGVSQGLAYVVDFAAHEPVPVAVASVLFLAACLGSRESVQRAALAGVLLYVAYVVWIGGDFMRGRMLLPAFVAGAVGGVLALAHASRPGRAVFVFAAASVVLLALQVGLAPPPSAAVSEDGIVDEQAYYPGYRLGVYLDRGRVVSPYLNLDFADDLRAFADRCGPVTIHARNPGTIGYFAGPQVSVIDTLGLTDAFIARLPRSKLVAGKPRPGHPDKFIPLAYLASRKDISIVPDWEPAVAGLDCSVIDRTAALAASGRHWTPR
jgi:arabinofuranosyltransferase